MDVCNLTGTHEENTPVLPEIMGKNVSEDEKGNICLNDLWEIAGKPENLRPTSWHRQKRTLALEGALQERIMFLKHKSQKEVENSTYYVSGRGASAKTFAHPVLALEYAENINPALGVEVKEVFLRYRANDISLANDILDRMPPCSSGGPRRLTKRLGLRMTRGLKRARPWRVSAVLCQRICLSRTASRMPKSGLNSISSCFPKEK